MPVIRHHKYHKEAGFHLIESLVTLFILTVGILGVAGLQAVAIRSHQDSVQRSQAIILAQSMADRIRANVEGAQFYDQSNVANSPAETASCFAAVGCSSQQMALTDLFQWQHEVESALPLGQGYVCQDSSIPTKVSLAGSGLSSNVQGSCDGSGDTFVVHIWWDKNNDNAHQLEVNPGTGALDSNSSDEYLQLVFEP